MPNDNSGQSGRTYARNFDVAPLRRKLESIFLHTVRAYTFNTPLSKGKYRAFMIALDICKSLPESEIVPTKDGRRVWADLSTGMHEGVFFLGEYEHAITELTKLLVKEGDVCFDVGANFGWYTSLLHNLGGSSGQVHAFEPVPPTYDELIRNCNLIAEPAPKNIHLNNFALGQEEGQFTVNLFAGLTTGHASLSDQGRNDATPFECQVITLDAYLKDNKIQKADFVKVDIEGSELNFLKGADGIFQLEKPPSIIMEMALNTTRNFGYIPNDLIKFIASQGEYKFYKIDEASFKLLPICGFSPDDIGANVLCVPGARIEMLSRLRGWI